VYEGAVYMHQGKTYLVKTLDLSAKVAMCQKADLKYYTKTRDFTDVHVIGGELAYPRTFSGLEHRATTAQANLCKVTTKWIGFRRIWCGSNEVFDTVDLFLPEYSYESQAVWIRVPHQIRTDIEKKNLSFRAGLHAASHALLNIMPLYIMCNPSDLGTECANPHDSRYFPERLLLFDRHCGSIGIAPQARPLFPELLQAALELLVKCECSAGTGNDLRRKGLYFNCKDPWSPDCHCLGKGRVHYIEVFSYYEEEGAKSEEVMPKHESDEDIDSLDDTLATLSNAPRYHPFCVKGALKGQQVTILIDSGAMHNFIDEGLVARMGLEAEDFKGFKVVVANGVSIPCTNLPRGFQSSISPLEDMMYVFYRLE
ncbi:hypothetical protein KI387_001550, partial [Taxus chinensis]